MNIVILIEGGIVQRVYTEQEDATFEILNVDQHDHREESQIRQWQAIGRHEEVRKDGRYHMCDRGGRAAEGLEMLTATRAQSPG